MLDWTSSLHVGLLELVHRAPLLSLVSWKVQTGIDWGVCYEQMAVQREVLIEEQRARA